MSKKLKFGQIDAKYMKQGEELLFGELSVALHISLADVPGYIYIEQRIKNKSKHQDASL